MEDSIFRPCAGRGQSNTSLWVEELEPGIFRGAKPPTNFKACTMKGCISLSSMYLALTTPLFWESHMCRPLSYANLKQRIYCTVERLRRWNFEELSWSLRDDYVTGKICISEHDLLIGEIVLANHCSFLWASVCFI